MANQSVLGIRSEYGVIKLLYCMDWLKVSCGISSPMVPLTPVTEPHTNHFRLQPSFHHPVGSYPWTLIATSIPRS
jgi:hypothetical protein